MKKLLIFLLLLPTLALGQSKRVYAKGIYINVANSDGTGITPYYGASVAFQRSGTNIVLFYGGSSAYLAPSEFLNEAGAPYGATVDAALSGYTTAAAGLLLTSSATIIAATYASAVSQCAALPAGVAALVKVTSDESAGNAGTGPGGANPATQYTYFPGVGLTQIVLYPN